MSKDTPTMPEMQPSAAKRLGTSPSYSFAVGVVCDAYRDGYAAALASLSLLVEAARREAFEKAATRIKEDALCWPADDAIQTGLAQLAYEVRALSTLPAPASQWRPIETAPKDGTRVLLGGAGDGSVMAGSWWWQSSQWHRDGGLILAPQPTHWQPLPTPPSTSDRGE